MGWWFGRIMTFEVIADAAAPAIGDVLGDASAGAIAVDAGETVVGYAAYGRSIGAAVESLVESFDLPLFDDGERLRAPQDDGTIAVDAAEFGNSADGGKAPRIQREQLPMRSVPSVLRLSYYDPERDYQAGEARAAAGEQAGTEVRRELPAVLAAGDAKRLAQQMLARQWAERDRLTLRLPPARMAIEPGSTVKLPLTPSLWTVYKCTLEAFVAIVELRPCYQASAPVAADAGRILASNDVVEEGVVVALLDAPDVMGVASDSPTLLVAASAASPGWRARALAISSAGQVLAAQSARRKSVLGQAVTILAEGSAVLADATNAVEIALVDPDQWLTSCTDDALAQGANLAVLGSELIQFADVTSLGGGRFRLARLLRGRGGTESAIAGHAVGEIFCLAQRESLQPLALPGWTSGTTLTATDHSGASAAVTVAGNALKPFAPVNLVAALQGDLTLSWTRRSRSGWGWLDEVDVPLGEAREQYRVTVISAGGALERTCPEPRLTIAAADLATLGAGAASVEVRQLGDWAASAPARATINL